MIVRCYGARGGIPVSGKEYLKYGGDTTCLEVRDSSRKIIIIDAGSGIRRLGKKMLNDQDFECNIIFTHTHQDHIMGFPFFKPIFNEMGKINLIGCNTAQGNLKQLLSRVMCPPYFPVPFENLRARINYLDDACSNLTFRIDSIDITPINLSHPNSGLGYKFTEDGKAFVFLTDNELSFRHRGGCTFEEYAEFAKDAELLIHDAEYTPEEYESTRSWGHSTYIDALNLAIKAGVKRFGLFHHNQDRSDTDLDAIVQRCQEILESKNIDMQCFALTQTTEIRL